MILGPLFTADGTYSFAVPSSKLVANKDLFIVLASGAASSTWPRLGSIKVDGYGRISTTGPVTFGCQVCGSAPVPTTKAPVPLVTTAPPQLPPTTKAEQPILTTAPPAPMATTSPVQPPATTKVVEPVKTTKVAEPVKTTGVFVTSTVLESSTAAATETVTVKPVSSTASA